MKCKECKEKKVKKPEIRNGVTRYFTEDGRMWNGKICPSCYKIYNRNRMRNSRNQNIKPSSSDESSSK